MPSRVEALSQAEVIRLCITHRDKRLPVGSSAVDFNVVAAVDHCIANGGAGAIYLSKSMTRGMAETRLRNAGTLRNVRVVPLTHIPARSRLVFIVRPGDEAVPRRTSTGWVTRSLDEQARRLADGE